ncbi:unnamed protein product [Owenia fusiformis]|uniref:Uncharacterized protein n=1 Tax=Owenia fusiformis TaxID=6347 RepID=A0A8J1UCZ5_OWEFU|nr:unnamed protein product [Owenia fusiformis]
MTMGWYSLCIVIALCAICTLGKKHGGPDSACSSLTPRHGNNTAQVSSSPYTIRVISATQYKRGTKVMLQLTGPAFQGVMIQARKKGSNAIVAGQFADFPPYTKAKKCTNDADTITHSAPDNKTNIEFSWNPPNQADGDIEFYGTVLQKFDTFWLEHKSATLKPADDYKGSAGMLRIATALLGLPVITMILIF